MKNEQVATTKFNENLRILYFWGKEFPESIIIFKHCNIRKTFGKNAMTKNIPLDFLQWINFWSKGAE